MQSISLTFLPINNIILNILFICPTLKQKNIDFLACSKFYALAVFEYTRYCQGTKLNTQDTLKSISKEIGFFYFDLKSELSRQRLKFKSKDGN